MMHWQVFYVLLIVCLLYLVVIWITYSWMIAAPRKSLLRSQIDRLTNLVRAVMLAGDTAAIPVATWLEQRLATVRQGLNASEPGAIPKWLFNVNLNSLMATQQTVNGLGRLRVYLVPDVDLPAIGAIVFARLEQEDQANHAALLAEFEKVSDHPSAQRVLIARADELCDARQDASLRAEFDRERASLWLALVGLWGIIAIGALLGHVETLLLGAVGGFLAPLIDARLTSVASKPTWGVRVLSPVGGALTAVGGLLVVSFLASADVKILGAVFTPVWTEPGTPVALAVALLFGFSGKMFSNMAITASSQIAGASQPDAGAAADGTAYTGSAGSTRRISATAL